MKYILYLYIREIRQSNIMPISKVRYNIRRVKRKWDVQWFVSPRDEGEDGDKCLISSIEGSRIRENTRECTKDTSVR